MVCKKNKKKYEISGTILINHDYCSGARPMEDERRPYAAPGTKLYVRKSGSLQILDSVTADSAGKFSIKLNAGNYCFVEKEKTAPLVMPKNSQHEVWDTACYRAEYNKCNFELTVSKNTSDVKITLRRYCAWTRPCCRYSGPLPPSAPPTNRGGFQPGHQE
jgi:hypothetical protein